MNYLQRPMKSVGGFHRITTAMKYEFPQERSAIRSVIGKTTDVFWKKNTIH